MSEDKKTVTSGQSAKADKQDTTRSGKMQAIMAKIMAKREKQSDENNRKYDAKDIPTEKKPDDVVGEEVKKYLKGQIDGDISPQTESDADKPITMTEKVNPIVGKLEMHI